MLKRRDLVFYFLGKKYGFNFREHYDIVMENQYWKADQIHDYQLGEVKKILHHAWDNVPYYRRKFTELGFHPGDFKELSDLKKLPILRKEEIYNFFGDFLAKDYKQYHPMERFTGGTTGMAFPYYQDLNSWAQGWATKVRTFEWGGYTFGYHKLGVMAGGSLLPQGKSTFKKKFWQYLNNYYPMPIMHFTDEIMTGYAEGMKKHKVRFLRGYPSAIYTFAKFLRDKDAGMKLKAVFTTAEMLHDHQRELIEGVFQCKAFDTYGCGDGMGSANECEAHEGLHVNIETSLMSIVDKNGNDVSPGEEGEIILTSFNNLAMPFIRYAPGDMALVAEKECSCGRKLPLLKKIIGRTSDLIEFSNGRKLNGLSIPFEAYHNILVKFQIVQTDHDAVEVNLVKKDAYTDQDEKHILGIMRYHVGEGVRIKINYVNDIPLPKSGKFRYVISKYRPQ